MLLYVQSLRPCRPQERRGVAEQCRCRIGARQCARTAVSAQRLLDAVSLQSADSVLYGYPVTVEDKPQWRYLS